MMRVLLSLCLTAFIVQGCTSTHATSVAGKYSRTARAGYKNTTELKPDGSYVHSTDRGGKFRVLETGIYEVTGDTIIFRPKTGSQAGEVQKYPFDGKVIYPGRWKSPNGKMEWIREYERVKE